MIIIENTSFIDIEEISIILRFNYCNDTQQELKPDRHDDLNYWVKNKIIVSTVWVKASVVPVRVEVYITVEVLSIRKLSSENYHCLNRLLPCWWVGLVLIC
jgi:hypothetical protein